MVIRSGVVNQCPVESTDRYTPLGCYANEVSEAATRYSEDTTGIEHAVVARGFHALAAAAQFILRMGDLGFAIFGAANSLEVDCSKPDGSGARRWRQINMAFDSAVGLGPAVFGELYRCLVPESPSDTSLMTAGLKERHPKTAQKLEEHDRRFEAETGISPLGELRCLERARRGILGRWFNFS